MGQIPTGEVISLDGMLKSVTVKDGHCVGDTVSRVKYETSGLSRTVESQDSLYGEIKGGDSELLKHDLDHCFAIELRISWN
jgi:hypothetical protein